MKMAAGRNSTPTIAIWTGVSCNTLCMNPRPDDKTMLAHAEEGSQLNPSAAFVQAGAQHTTRQREPMS